MRRFFLILILALFGCAHEADGRPKGGIPNGSSPPPSTCPYTFVPADDGCLSANQNAQVIFPNFFTDVRQSGQGQYKTSGAVGSNHPVGWNVPGVDYPVGNITPDGSLTPVSSLSVSGCTYSAGPPAVYTCTGATDKTISGAIFSDTTLDDNSTSHTTTLTNNTFILGYNNCNGWGSIPFVDVEHGSQSVIATNNKWITDTLGECSYIGNIFGLSNDPGLTVNSQGVANFSGTSMTYTSGPTLQNGTHGIHLWQHIHYSGQTNNPACPPVSTGNCTTSSPGSAPQIVGTCGANCYTLDTAQSTSTGKTVTTGPQIPSVYGNLGINEIGAGSLTAKYNASIGWSTTFAVTSGGSSDVQNNYVAIYGDVERHVNFVQQQPTACDPGGASNACATVIPKAWQKFNVGYFPSYAAVSGTTIYGPFSTSFTANTTVATGYQNTYTDVNSSYNIGVANITSNGWLTPGVTTDALFASHNQQGTFSAKYTGTASGTNMTVSGITGSINVGDYITDKCGGCGSVPHTTAIKITGTCGANCWVMNQSLTFSGQVLEDFLYPGAITSLTIVGNAFDPTGADTAISLDEDSVYGSKTISGNWNPTSGAACNTPNVSC